jgi:hypothetical protein
MNKQQADGIKELALRFAETASQAMMLAGADRSVSSKAHVANREARNNLYEAIEQATDK